jgi:CRISPR/Cas system CMR-associated protein Cmr5 small subunit
MSRETLLSFPDFSKLFHIYADASDYQLGSVIMQDGKLLAFYSSKLDKAQRNYTTGEQEKLMSIVETRKVTLIPDLAWALE